jgi:glycosyltransferase involved in cell wall biosynthesis
VLVSAIRHAACRSVGSPDPVLKKQTKIRVLLVGPSLDILGGQAVQAKRLLEGLSASECVEVSFLAVNPRLKGLFGSLQQIKYVRTVVTSVAYLAALVRRVPSVDVVHAFSASYFSYLLAPFPAMLVAKCFGKATVLNYRSGEADDHLTRWRLTATPTMRRLADAIVTPSEYLVGVFSQHSLHARSVSNFVPLDRLPYRRREGLAPRFLSNRNLEGLYNVACTIRAFALVQARYSDATITIAGDGSCRAELEALVQSLNLTGVRFVGRVSNENMGALYAAADVYLNSPNIDNMPGSIIEAFACGLPVVSTNAGGIPFVVDHERTGLLVSCNDHEAMAVQALRLLENPTLATVIADAARHECEQRYVWSAVRERWEAVYREVGKNFRAPVR